MIASIHTSAPVLTLDDHEAREFDGFDLSEFQRDFESKRGMRTHVRRPHHTADLSSVVPRLFQLNLSSLSAYTEIADLATDAELRDFAQVMIRQRLAQCRALSRIAQPVPPPRTSETTCELRFAWLRALWSLEQDDMVAFSECAEHAESLLEDALVEAADAVVDQPVADLLYELAINVCGARERFEELASLSADRATASFSS